MDPAFGPAFSKDEYNARVVATRHAMEARGLDLLIVTDPANMGYLTGYDGWSFYVPQAVAVALAEPWPIWMGRGMDANAARLTTYLPDGMIVPYPDTYVHNPEAHALEFMARELAARGLTKGRIGVEMDTFQYSARAHAALAATLPDAETVDATRLVNWIRLIKSPAEIAYLREAGRLAELAMASGIAKVAVGVRQCDASAAIFQAQIAGTNDFGGDYPAIVPMLPSGRGTNTPHLTWSDAPFRENEATILELAGCRRRYHCPLARTVLLGEPIPRLAHVAEVLVEALETAVETIRPGVAAEEVVAAWQKVVRPHGIEKDSRMGYSIGLNYPPDWGEGTVSLRAGDRTELQAGMALHVMPGYWTDDWGIEISESVLITETGAECLVHFPRELAVKPV